MTPLEWGHFVGARLEEAGVTLLCLRDREAPTGMRTGWPAIVQEWTAYSPGAAGLRWPPPSAAAISRMDEALSWLGYLPFPPDPARRIVGARMLVHPLRGDYLVSWRKIARLVRADHHWVQRRHGMALAVIARELREGKNSPCYMSQNLALESLSS